MVKCKRCNKELSYGLGAQIFHKGSYYCSECYYKIMAEENKEEGEKKEGEGE